MLLTTPPAIAVADAGLTCLVFKSTEEREALLQTNIDAPTFGSFLVRMEQLEAQSDEVQLRVIRLSRGKWGSMFRDSRLASERQVASREV